MATIIQKTPTDPYLKQQADSEAYSAQQMQQAQADYNTSKWVSTPVNSPAIAQQPQPNVSIPKQSDYTKLTMWWAFKWIALDSWINSTISPTIKNNVNPTIPSTATNTTNNWGISPNSPLLWNESLTYGSNQIAQEAADKTKNLNIDLQVWAKSRDLSLESSQQNADHHQAQLDLQNKQTQIQYDREIQDTVRVSDRNINILEMTSALTGINRSSWFSDWVKNLREDTTRTLTRLNEDLKLAKDSTWEASKALWQNYNSEKQKINLNFDNQYRDFVNRQTASTSQLSSAWYDPKKMNDAVDKIYTEAHEKTTAMYSNYVNSHIALNNNAMDQAEALTKQKNNDDTVKRNFINQYIWFNGEHLAGQSVNDLKEMYSNGQISKTDLNLYSEMINTKTITTLWEYGVPTQDDVNTTNELIQKWYTPMEAIAYMVQNHPDRFNPEIKAQKQAYTKAQQQMSLENLKSQNDYNRAIWLENMKWQNDYNLQSLKGQQAWSTTTTTGLWDMRNLASQFPNQARAKNNNPAWITWNANFDNPTTWSTASLLQQAGINFQKGTQRPANEWGNYVTFATMEDGLAAQKVMMTQTYGNKTVGQMLSSWVGTWEWPNYAKQVAWMAGIDLNVVVNQLNKQQVDTLQMAKIQKESPGLAKILQEKSYKPETQSNPIITTILWSGKFTKDQAKSISNAINSGEDPKTVILNQAKDIMGTTQATSLSKMEVARQQVQDIDWLLKQYYAWWWDTWVFAWWYEKTINRLWEVSNPDLVWLATQISSALQVYRNAVSGTAYSEKEWQEIASIFPWINKWEWLNKAIIKWRLAAFDSTIDATYRTAIWSAYDKIKSWTTTATKQPTSQPATSWPVNPTAVKWWTANDPLWLFN